jgi:hypothetical protein
MTDASEWNPNDPDATQVHYDLSAWSFDDQAELAAAMAEEEIPHSWDGTDLIVPERAEARADDLISRIEVQLGIADGSGDDDESTVGGDPWSADAPPPEPILLEAFEPGVEYDLDEWSPEERELIAVAVIVDGHAHRWEGTRLIVAEDAEGAVDALLDQVEAGLIEFEPDEAQLAAEQLPFETLTTFFLAADRLRRNATSPDGLVELLKAFEVSDVEQPPFGVEKPLWTRTCALAEELVAALVDGDRPEHEAAEQIADELHDLLRPYV